MHRRAFLLTASAAATATAARAAAPGAPNDLEARLDAYFAPFVAARDFSGVVTLAKGPDIIARRIYGMADFDRRTPNTPDTAFFVASIGKSFTRASLLALERAGKLAQDDPLARFAPEFPNAANITLRQLIEHKAGITRDLQFGADLRKVLSLSEMARRIATLPLAGQPGEKYAYSNNGYRLLALVVERASGGDYGDFVREAVFEPRGMRHTFEPGRGRPRGPVAKGHVAGIGFGTLAPPEPIEVLNHRGAGSFCSTPNDLLRYARSLPLAPADLQRPLQTREDGTTARRVLGHDGLGNGFSNLCFRFPEQDACLVMSCNIETPIFGPLHDHLEQFLFGEAVTPPPIPAQTAAPFDAGRAALFVGQYELFPGTPLIIRRETWGLSVSAGGDSFLPLTPVGSDRYLMRQKYAYLDFKVVDGRTESVTWTENGSPFVLRRLG